MHHLTPRRRFLGLLGTGLAWSILPGVAQNTPDEPPHRRARNGARLEDYVLPAEFADYRWLSLVLGRVTEHSATLSVFSLESIEAYFEYGPTSGQYNQKTPLRSFPAGRVAEIVLNGLALNTRYYYRLQYRKPGTTEFSTRPENQFQTARAAGNPFTFTIQGDSHPERPQMSHPELYARTLQLAAASRPDFHLCMGDDFSVDTIPSVTWAAVAERYTLQRPFLGLVGQSAPLFLLNGNHEQASRFNYDQKDERHQVAVMAQAARNYYYPTPTADEFYQGDNLKLPGIGALKDYCAWTWGDALFVILDNYWQSPAQVDSGFHERPPNGGERPGGGGKRKGDRLQGFNGSGPRNAGAGGHAHNDFWAVTMGGAQYHWFKQTLEQSRARYKFVFAHHVLGTGRGGVDVCDLYEWGGRNRRGDWEFSERRPGWELPVHQLMVKHGVSVFFQGHDHLYCQQERDGIIYQEVPMPADHGYQTYNEDRYASGVKLPNSGFLRVTVTPEQARVEYLRSYLPESVGGAARHGEVAHSYVIQPRVRHA